MLAEGLLAESFLDSGDRSNFENGGPVVRLHPEFTVRFREAAGYAPLVVTGPVLETARAWLLRRATQLATDERRGGDARSVHAA